MPGGYWWECEKCAKQFDFRTACASRGVAHYIQDHLKKDWAQTLLVRDCPECNSHSLRIAYEFPRQKGEKQCFRVYHVVGIDWNNGKYVPMMWATKQLPYNGEMLYDFKYISGRSIFGLSKAAVFSQKELRKVFDLYCQKIGTKSFP
jgi:hypothetical protein